MNYVLASEVYPTTIRAMGVGVSSSIGWLGAAMVPIATQVLVISHPVAVLCTKGSLVLLAGLAVICLPKDTTYIRLQEFIGQKTSNSNLPDTTVKEETP
ncbi:hypothetical protein NPIL_467301 [Nephila pilipes]|uniref:Major facilitator superfamily (MFS) profile domain-containing protein n=1 Tax=Nephila pilipes TaxID=299642 RepID=A0A8X6QA43_NEPPI|nr:hypothetical protein NPIL_467301 [Nephila pilipes]